ncbi:MAG TPA: hypothetical protein VM901_10395 [Bdellovibrionota bacterium]|nr:hypothetical protein [Bdellovibrionota bacterium]
MAASTAFSLGAVVFPATDSLLATLGIDVEARGLDCLGIVIEERTSKAKIYFPCLDLNVWLDHDELRDVGFEHGRSNAGFASLHPEGHPELAEHPAWLGQWWIAQLEPIEILETQSGEIGDLWSREDGPLANHFTGDALIKVFKLSLAIEELDLAHWKSLEDQRSESLALVRFLPAGMHKLEIQLFLRS